jgi:hypothetical protein
MRYGVVGFFSVNRVDAPHAEQGAGLALNDLSASSEAVDVLP